jgi:hypothetical protein
MKFKMVTKREIYCDYEDNSHFEIGADKDDMGCVEIKYCDKNGKITESMSFPPEQANLIAKAIELCANEMINSRITFPEKV